MIVVIIAGFVVYVSTAKPVEMPTVAADHVDGDDTPCSTDSDCAYPLYCILSTCRPLGNSGDACGTDTDCNAPLYCISGTCSLGSGGSVAGGGANTVKGASCSSDSDCMPPLYCILHKCNPLGMVGEGCTYDYDCQYPYVCESGKCASKPTAGGGSGSATPGTPCSTDVDCMPPLFCILKTCRYLGKVGDSCATNADCTMPLVCEKSKCIDTSGGAVSSYGTGAAAGAEVECKKDADCVKKGAGFKFCIANQCRKNLSAAGEACQYTTDCQEGLFCIVGVCRKEQSESGEPCRSNDDCKRPNLCINFVCSEN